AADPGLGLAVDWPGGPRASGCRAARRGNGAAHGRAHRRGGARACAAGGTEAGAGDRTGA
ncbi:hypothetical protein ABTL30_19680, partial [Acinetobacter baumannii]